MWAIWLGMLGCDPNTNTCESGMRMADDGKCYPSEAPEEAESPSQPIAVGTVTIGDTANALDAEDTGMDTAVPSECISNVSGTVSGTEVQFFSGAWWGSAEHGVAWVIATTTTGACLASVDIAAGTFDADALGIEILEWDLQTAGELAISGRETTETADGSTDAFLDVVPTGGGQTAISTGALQIDDVAQGGTLRIGAIFASSGSDEVTGQIEACWCASMAAFAWPEAEVR